MRVPEWRIWLKSLKAFKFSVLALTMPGLHAEDFKILCTFNLLHHFDRP
jgi:hypothetical protein